MRDVALTPTDGEEEWSAAQELHAVLDCLSDVLDEA
jgi:hypothetical protein